MSDSDLSDVQRLIRLKRHERPPDGYYENFLLEFQHRQRADMLRRSAFSLWLEKVATWFSSFGTRKWVYAGGAAYAALMIAAYLYSDPVDSSSLAEEEGPTPNGATPIELANPADGRGATENKAGAGSDSEAMKDRDEGLQPVSSPGFREL